MQITDLIRFDLREKSIKTSVGEKVFYRFDPPNISILAPQEVAYYVRKFANFIQHIPDIPLQIFITDRTEDLSKNRKYWKCLNPKYAEFTDVIVSELSKGNSSSNGTQRGFYFVITVKKDQEQERFENVMRECDFPLTRIEKNEIVSVLRGFLLRDFNDYPIEPIEQEVLQEYDSLSARKKKKVGPASFRMTELAKRLLPTNMNIRPMYIEQSDFLRQTLLIKNLPMSFDTLCLLRKLAQIKDTTMSMRITEMNQGTAVNLIDKQLRNALSDTQHKEGVEQLNANVEHNEMVQFYQKFNSDKDKIFYLNIYIECYGNTLEELNSKRISVSNAMERCTYELLRYEQKEGFCGVCPLCEDKLEMLSNNVPGISAAALYPFSYSTRTDVKGFLLGSTEDGGYMLLDMQQRTLTQTNGNYVITGESGFGKSWLQKKILSQHMMKPNSGSFTFDHENEYADVYQKMGGTNINAIDSRYKLNPLQVRSFRTSRDDTLDEIDDNEMFKSKNYFSQHLSWLKEFMTLLIPHMTGVQRDLLMALIRDMYYFHSITEDTDFNQLKAEDYPTFTDLYQFVAAVQANPENYELYRILEKRQFAEIMLMLRDVTQGGLAPLFNGHTNLPNAHRLNINIQELCMGDAQRTQAYLYNMMTYMWSRIIERDIEFLLNVDELYLLCNKENMYAIQFLRNCIKRIRKYGSYVGTATQQLADVSAPEFYTYTAALFNTPAIKFLFNPGQLDTNTYKRLTRLTENEIERLQTLVQRECMVLVGNDKYKVKIGTLSYEAALFGAGGGR